MDEKGGLYFFLKDGVFLICLIGALQVSDDTSAEKKTSEAVLGVAAITQSICTSMGITNSAWPVLIWALAGFFLIARVVPWNRTIKYSVLAIGFVAIVGFIGWVYNSNHISIAVSNNPPFIESDHEGKKWVRFSVTNSSFVKKTCRAFLNDLQKANDSKYFIRDEHRMLTADDSGDPEIPNGFVLTKDIVKFFNIALIYPESNVLTIASKSYNDLTREPLVAGKYILKIEVSGPDCGPTYDYKKIDYKGGQDVLFVE